MSSILDALNKAEDDRNAAASDGDDDAPFVPEAAAETLIAQPKRKRAARQPYGFNWKPLFYAAGGLAGIAVIVGLSAGAALLAGKASHGSPVMAAAVTPAEGKPLQAVGKETYTVPVQEPKESPAPAADAKAAATPVEKAVEKPQEPRPLPVVEAKVVKPKPKSVPVMDAKAPLPERFNVAAEPSAPEPAAPAVRTAKAAPVPEAEPTTPLPTPEAIERARHAADEKPPATVPLRTSPVSLAPGRAAEKHAPFLEDVNALPRLGQNERERLGMIELRLNVLREASASQPEGLAIINLKKVYVGEMIPGTSARLIAVQSRAIAIEVEGTGERFKVMN